MEGLAMFLAGLVIACAVEDLPRWVKTVIWALLLVFGIVLGALRYFRVGA